jgi:hypothetical protein
MEAADHMGTLKHAGLKYTYLAVGMKDVCIFL